MGNYLASSNTLMFHLICLTVSWNILANIAVYAALYRHRIQGYYIHAILCWLIIILTLVCTLLYIIPKGMPSLCYISGQIQCDQYQFPLAIEGTILTVWLAIQVFSGIFTRAWQENPLAKSLSVIRSRRFHQYSGWFILLLGKTNCLIHWRNQVYMWIPLLVWEIISIIAYIQRKYFYKRLESSVLDPQTYQNNTKLDKIKSLQQLGKDKRQYFVFANKVYEIWPLLTLHPAGHQVIKFTKGSQVDRIIYGMYGPAQILQISPYPHSLRSLELCGKPIAEISIPSPFDNMGELNNCLISYKETVSEKNQISIIGLTALSEQKVFTFKGYTQLPQVGQYFSLTYDNNITRLYTTVNCLAPSNRRIMESISVLTRNSHEPVIGEYFNKKKVVERNKKLNESEERVHREMVGTYVQNVTDRAETKQIREIEGQIPDVMIPLMIKKYDTGKLTPILFDDQSQPKNLLISCPRGQGLKLEHLPAGKVVFMAGGTGFYPFMDLVDLLFKQAYLKNQFENQQTKDKIRSLNPILNEEIIPNLTFSFYVSVKALNDLHPISLYQLNYLCEKQPNRFKCFFRIAQGKQEFEALYSSIEVISMRFNELLIPEAMQEITRKIYICGPPEMNTSLSLQLTQSKIQQDKFQFV